MIADQTRFILAAKHRRVVGSAIIARTFADSSSRRRCRFVLADLGVRVSGVPQAPFQGILVARTGYSCIVAVYHSIIKFG